MDRVAGLKWLFSAAIDTNHAALAEAAVEVEYLDGSSAPAHRDAVVDLLLAASEPLRHPGAYDFGQSDLSSRMAERVLQMRLEARIWQIPPTDLLFLHRRFGGLFMLCQRLRARVDAAALAASGL